MKNEWTLRELAAETGVPARTIRFYISKGLLHPPLRSGRGAVYGAEHKLRLEEIRRLQRRGFMLAEIAHELTLDRARGAAAAETLDRSGIAGAGECAGPPVSEAPQASASGLYEAGLWRSYAIGGDVILMLRVEASPWRTRRVLSALRQFAALVGPEPGGDERDDVSGRQFETTDETKEDENE